MTWENILTDVVRFGNISGAAHSYVRGQIIQAAVRAGASSNAIIRHLSANGLGIRRQQELQMIAGERSRQMAGATANQIPLDVPVSEIIGTEPPIGWTGQYVHQVAITWRERDEAGNYLLHTRTVAIKSASLLTPDEAGAAAMDIMATQILPNEPPNYPLPGDVIGVNLSGAWWDVQNRNLRSFGIGG